MTDFQRCLEMMEIVGRLYALLKSHRMGGEGGQMDLEGGKFSMCSNIFRHPIRLCWTADLSPRIEGSASSPPWARVGIEVAEYDGEGDFIFFKGFFYSHCGPDRGWYRLERGLDSREMAMTSGPPTVTDEVAWAEIEEMVGRFA